MGTPIWEVLDPQEIRPPVTPKGRAAQDNDVQLVFAEDLKDWD